MLSGRLSHRVLIPLWSSLAAWALVFQLGAAEQSGTVNDGGVRLDWRYETLSETDGAGLGRLRLSLRDSVSLSPIRYQTGELVAWLQRNRNALSDSELACKDKVRMLASLGVGRRAEIDLNAYRIVTLNRDRTLAFINPFVGLNNAKLESIVSLPGDPLSWVFIPQRMEYWVVTISPGFLLAIDAYSRQILRRVAIADSMFGRSRNIDLGFDGRRLWLSLPGAGKIGFLDITRANSALETVIAPGIMALHTLALPDKTAILSVHRGGRVQRWRAEAATPPEIQQQWSFESPPRQLAYSALSNRFVATDGGQFITFGAGTDARSILDVSHDIERFGLFDRGRYALVVGDGRMSLYDLASNRRLSGSVAVGPVRDVVFTNSFAYAVSLTQSEASLWSLAKLRTGQAQPIEVLLGSPYRTDTSHSTGLSKTAVDPAGNGLLVANTPDALIYQYAEGMMAPIGSYSNYKRSALAVKVLDLSPREIAPGEFESVVRHERGGGYEFIVSGLSPRFVACDRMTLANPSGITTAPNQRAVHARLIRHQLIETGRLRIELSLFESDADGHEHPIADGSDLILLAFDKRAIWQQRVGLRVADENPGHYVAELTLPHAVSLDLFVGSVDLDLPFMKGHAGHLDLRLDPRNTIAREVEP